MYITKITLKNYRCYKDLSLSLDPINFGQPSNIFLFSGKTGAGKTSLMNAIGWCLTGKEAQELLDGPKHEKPIVGDYCDISKQREVQVELNIKFAPGNKIKSATIKRSSEYIAETTSPSTGKVELTLHMGDGTSKQHTSDDLDGKKVIGKYLEELYPAQLSKFYLFDSEFMARAYSGNIENVSSSLKDMFKVSAINTLASRLDAIKESFSKEIEKIDKGSGKIKKLNQDIGTYKTEVGKLDNEITEIGETLKKKQDELAQENINIGGLEQKLRNAPDLGAIKQEMEKLEQEKEKNRGKRNNLLIDIAKNAVNNFPFLIAMPALKKALQKIEEGQINGTLAIPPKIEYSLITEIIKQKKCICGRSVEDRSEEMESLNILKMKAEEEKGESILKDFAMDLTYKIGSPPKVMEQYSRDSGTLEDLQQRYEDIESRISELIGEKSVGSDIQQWYHELEETNGKVGVLKEDIDVNQKKLEQKTNSRNSLSVKQNEAENNRKSEIDKIKGNEYLKSQMKIAGTLKGIFEKMPSLLLKKFSESIEENINSLIAGIPAMQNKIASVRVAKPDTLSLKFLDPANPSSPTYLSGGQSRIVGISVISAFIKIFSQISDYAEIPFISIDNPFSGMDVATSKLFYAKLGEFLSGTQGIIFVPDTLLNEYKVQGKASIRKTYLIKNEGGISTIEEVH